MKSAVRVHDESSNTMAGLLLALPMRAALLDTAGVVIQSNDRADASETPAGLPLLRAGQDFLKLCRAAKSLGSGDATALTRGFRAVAGGRKDAETIAFSCGQNGNSRNFRVQLSATQSKGRTRVLLCQEALDAPAPDPAPAHLPATAAIGRMTLSIAHDFNNMLTIVQGYADALAARIGNDAPAAERMVKLRTAIERAASLAQRLLEIGRGTPGPAVELNLNTTINDLSDLLAHICGKRIQLSVTLSRTPCRILGDRLRVEQILLNLALNARDAMPGGGKLQIATKLVRSRAAAKSPMVELSVRDTGMGMSEEIRARAFDPFFTTKSDDNGLGLGLHSVAEAVRGLNGQIEVQSVVGKGTTFTARFPACGD